MSFICGSFKSQEEDNFEVLWPSLPTPSRKTRRNRFCCGRKKEDKKNPFSNCGLDKFEALLAELDDKKRKIFTQKGSRYISFVRFVYSNSNNVKPIIVRLRNPKKHDKDHCNQNNIKGTKTSTPLKLQVSTLDNHHNSNPLTKIGTKEFGHHEKAPINKVMKKIRVDQWKLNIKMKLEEWWMPSYNLPLFVMVVMLLLTLFGRSLAIICTSIAWYLIPKIDERLAIKHDSEEDGQEPARTQENQVKIR